MPKLHQPRLLPHHYKKIGLYLALAGIAYIGIIIILNLAFKIETEGKHTHLHLSLLLQIIGLCTRSLSKEKQEDELMMQLRLKSFSSSIFGAAAFAFVASLFALLGEPLEWPIPVFVVWLLWLDQIVFWQLKKSFFKQNS